jgi:hypothetical protein
VASLTENIKELGTESFYNACVAIRKRTSDEVTGILNAQG